MKNKNDFDFQGNEEELTFGEVLTAEGKSHISIYIEIGKRHFVQDVSYQVGEVYDFTDPKYFAVVLCGDQYSAGANFSSPAEVAGKIVKIVEDYPGDEDIFARVEYQIAE